MTTTEATTVDTSVERYVNNKGWRGDHQVTVVQINTEGTRG